MKARMIEAPNLGDPTQTDQEEHGQQREILMNRTGFC